MAKELRPVQGREEFGQALRREQNIMELLLDDRELEKLRSLNKTHPAVERFDNISRYLCDELPFIFPNELEGVFGLGRFILDNIAMGKHLTAEEVLSRIADREVLHQLRRRAADPKMYADQMIAFNCWNLLKEKNLDAHLVEKESSPDISVLDEYGTKFWIECKHLRSGTSPSRIRKLIEKANKQIKSVDPNGAGALYIFVEHSGYLTVIDNKTPDNIKAYADEVERELKSGNSRSVAAVIIAWDDHLMFGAYPEPTLHVFRRQAHVRFHSAPRKIWKFPREIFSLERSAEFTIRFHNTDVTPDCFPTPNSIEIENLVITQLFRTTCDLTGFIRSIHAVAAMRQPDKFAEYDLGGLSVILVTKWVNLAHEPYLLLLIASRRPGMPIELMDGFRIYQDDVTLPTDPHPLEVLMRFLDVYGLLISGGGQKGMFLPHVTMPLSDCESNQVITVEAPKDEATCLSSFIKVSGQAPKIVDARWNFAYSKTRYQKDVRRHRL